ncbi:hypothetical protein M2475_000492 [Breznakia sp. PF5-3]|uniref:hypothetical protein n=1 Tax=unclassified Breznakia TaxID=2623764 RepID=UPI002406CCBE|nr:MULTISPECIES: hypothetical protein [unclassified Breznakia]MDF9824142.1 hypothetical protein [Breznakia sp. PM6-1]MDF9834940.1 hypothetical protein [Breznakia sp. PF5-3]MDF9837191.1 hypothetical protein [Breznakia sp. PFB2-8]MDF9859181.1 hypothetical protein [Breznakia sp. PH5-24]
MEHLVYTDKKSNVLENLLNKKKTMIVRGAAGRKLPHSRVFAGEILYFVENDGSGTIRARGVVSHVFNSEKMSADESIHLLEKNQEQLQLSDAQKKRWYGKKIICLVEVRDVEKIEPMQYDRQKNMDDWLIVEKIEDILEGSKAKEYKNIRIK